MRAKLLVNGPFSVKTNLSASENPKVFFFCFTKNFISLKSGENHKENLGCKIQDISTSISIDYQYHAIIRLSITGNDDDESNKHL